MKGNAQVDEMFEKRVRQLQEANAAMLKAFAPIFAELTTEQLQERCVGNKHLTNNLAEGFGAWRVLHGRCSWETLVSRSDVLVTSLDASVFAPILRKTDKDVTGWWPIRVPRILHVGKFSPRDDVIDAVRKRYECDRSMSEPAGVLQLFAFAARHLLLKEEITVATLDPELTGVIPVFTIRSSGPLQGRRIRRCYDKINLAGGSDVWLAFNDWNLTQGELSECH